MLASRTRVGMLIVVAACVALAALAMRPHHACTSARKPAAASHTWTQQARFHRILGEAQELQELAGAKLHEVTAVQRACPKLEGVCDQASLDHMSVLLDEASQLCERARAKLAQLPY